MVVLSESHEAVMQSVDSARVTAAYLEMGEHQVFFLAQVDEMMALEIPKIRYSQGPYSKWTIA